MLFSIEKAIFAIGKLTSAVVDDLIISIQVGASCANLFVSLGLAVCLPEFDGFVAVAFLLRTMFTNASPWSAFCACRHSCRQIRHSRVCSFKVLTGSLLRHVFVALCIGKRLCAMQNGQYCIAERHILPCETGYFAWQDGSSGIEKRSGGGLVVAVSAFHSAKTAFIFA